MYRRPTCQVVGRHPGRAPWEFRGPHVGWALLLDRRRLRGPDPCLLCAWGGLHLPPVLKLFWCCLTMTVLQTLSSFPTDYSGMVLSLQVSSSARHGTATGSSGAFRASQTRESAGRRPLRDDVQGGGRGLLHHPRCHLLLISPPNCLVLLSRYLLAHHQGWGGQHVQGAPWTSDPSCSLSQDTPAFPPKASGAFSWQTWLHIPVV